MEKAKEKGVDVSTFQGKVDWKKVKNAGMEFAFVRLGFRGYESGKIVLDSKFGINTDYASANFCKKYNLPYSGVINEPIWTKLLKG